MQASQKNMALRLLQFHSNQRSSIQIKNTNVYNYIQNCQRYPQIAIWALPFRPSQCGELYHPPASTGSDLPRHSTRTTTSQYWTGKGPSKGPICRYHSSPQRHRKVTIWIQGSAACEKLVNCITLGMMHCCVRHTSTSGLELCLLRNHEMFFLGCISRPTPGSLMG